MRYTIVILLSFITTFSFGQVQRIAGTYSSELPGIEIKLNLDSTFEYQQLPALYKQEPFSERGHWILSGDTIILNPQLSPKTAIASELVESGGQSDTTILLTFNHIKRSFDTNGNLIEADTDRIDQLDYAFNYWKKKTRVRVTVHPTTRCAFAGYIPKEIITDRKTIHARRPVENIKSVFISCSELQGIKEFTIKNPDSNHLTFNLYSNYYQDGQIRQKKFLIKDQDILYTRQKENGDFEKDNFWTETHFKLKRKHN